MNGRARIRASRPPIHCRGCGNTSSGPRSAGLTTSGAIAICFALVCQLPNKCTIRDNISRAQKPVRGRALASFCEEFFAAVNPIFLVALLCAATAWAEDSRVTALIVQGDAEERLHRTREALAALREAEAIEPRNVGVLLRISKQYSDLVSQAKTPPAAKALAYTALDYGKRAAEADPKNAKAHLNLAICYGKLTDYVGNKTKLEYSRIIRDEVQKSLALDDRDDFAWHVLGRWH